MATIDAKSLPPFSQISVSEALVTPDNFCGNYIAYPYYWNTSGFNLGINADYSASALGVTYGRNSTMELFNQADYVTSMRTFYPSASLLFSPTLGILGGTSFGWFLKLLDFWYSNFNSYGTRHDVLWIPEVFSAAASSTMTASIAATTLTVTAQSVTPIVNGAGVIEATVIDGTYIVSQLTGTNTPSASPTLSAGGVSGTNTFTVSSSSGVALGRIVDGTGIPAGTFVNGLAGNVVTLSQNFTSTGSGTYNFRVVGATGTYQISDSQTVTSRAMTACPFVWSGYGQASKKGEQALLDFWNAIFGSYASTSANDITTGSKSFTVATGLLIDPAVNYVKCYQTSNVNNFVWGQVTSYNSGTGALVLNVTAGHLGGTGTGITDWSIKFCSPLGYSLAEHPGLMGAELGNENVRNTTDVTAFARACRISYRLIKKYKAACKVILVSASNGSAYFAHMLAGSAASLIPAAADGDNGTGKQACDYIADGIAHHPYISGNTAAARAAAIADNSFGTATVYSNLGRNNGALNILCNYNPTCNLKINAIAPESIPFWVTETGPILTIVDPRSGGWCSFMASPAEKFNNLFRWVIPQLMTTRNGVGGIGRFFFYAFDSSGHNGGVSNTPYDGTTGSIANTTVDAAAGGQVRLNLSVSPNIAFSATVVHQSIVIKAGVSGWADLGLAGGASKRFTVSQVTGNQVYVHDTVFAAQPAENASYTEFQVDWSPFPEELKQLVDLCTNNGTGAYLSYGLIDYPNAPKGHWLYIPGVGILYTKANGAISWW